MAKKKPKAAKPQNGRAAVYLRKSRQDDGDGESNSITNQRTLTMQAASEAGYTDIREYKDDGISGTVMHRPGLDSMLEAVRNGEIQTIYVKDLSRLSRNRLQVELLRDEFSESGRQRHCTYRQRRLYQ